MSKIINSFVDLGLNANIIDVLDDIGYKIPLPIQIRCIPYLLDGYDVLGMAHTGSGKTAAFVLPLLQKIDIKYPYIQGLIIIPTRELTIQISKVCSMFSKYIKEINIVALYGGQSYNVELRALKRNPHIIVSTPGRLIDHLHRGTINLLNLKTLVIDEADEMLRMGFIEDVKYIITHLPQKRQTALFSATLPYNIRKISYEFMYNPKEIYIRSNTSVCADIKQNYWLVRGIAKFEALMRFLETEDFNAAIVFVRTKCATLEVSQALERFGYNSAALNGDMNQSVRHQTLDRFRSGSLDILIATDVAARGLDINRINLVINYDIPTNCDSYIHRIGRTGRAGCTGKSLLFIENKEYGLFCHIKRKINVSIKKVQYPTLEVLTNHRVNKFIKKVENQLCTNNLEEYRSLLFKINPNPVNITIENLAAVLLKMAQGNRPLVLSSSITSVLSKDKFVHDKKCIKKINDVRSIRKSNFCRLSKLTKKSTVFIHTAELYRISVGINDGLKARHIINVLSSKINISDNDIKNIKLFPSYTIIKLSKGLFNSKMLLELSHMRILNKPINMKFLKSVS